MLRRRTTVFALLLLPYVLAPTTNAAESDPIWPTLRGNYSRSGTSPYAGPLQGCAAWTFGIEGSVWTSVTVGWANRLHVAAKNGGLYTLDSEGSLIWQYDANTPLLSAPSVGPNGTIYVGGEDGRLFAVDREGHLRWTAQTDGFVYSSPAVSPDGTVYVGSQGGDLYAFDADGRERWRFSPVPNRALSKAIMASPTLGPDGTVYIGSLYDPNLYALNPEGGQIKWVCEFPELEPIPGIGSVTYRRNRWSVVSPVVAPSGVIYQTLLYDPHLYAIDPQDGTILWSTHLANTDDGWFEPTYPYPGLPDRAVYLTGESCWSEPVVRPDGTILVNLDDPYLRAVDPNGSIRWVTRLGDAKGFTLSTDGRGFVYAAGEQGGLHVVDPNGLEVARLEVDDAWLSYPVVTAEGTLIFTQVQEASLDRPVAKSSLIAIEDVDGMASCLQTIELPPPVEEPEQPPAEPNEPEDPPRGRRR